MFPTEFKDKILDLFKYRVSIDEDIEEKELNKLDTKFREKIDEFIAEETENIKFRAFQEIDDRLQELRGKFTKDLQNLERKHPIAYHRWRQEKKESFERFSESYAKLEVDLNHYFADLDNEFSSDGHKLLFLFSQAIINFQEVSNEVKESLQRVTVRRSHTKLGSVVNILTAMLIVLLRLSEIGRHWEEANEAQKKQMEDLLYWDLNTVSNYSLILPTKKEKIRAEIKPQQEVLKALFG
ncbi:MAG: hypothetical protein ACFFFG_11905 [Candidatus Thorarchaeota archaeon]